MGKYEKGEFLEGFYQIVLHAVGGCKSDEAHRRKEKHRSVGVVYSSSSSLTLEI